jgi:hypothetical protein
MVMVEMKGGIKDTFAKIPLCVKGLVWLDNLSLGGYVSLTASPIFDHTFKQITRLPPQGGDRSDNC